jgi:hypothetical protein
MTEPNDGLQSRLMEHVQRILVHGMCVEMTKQRLA